MNLDHTPFHDFRTPDQAAILALRSSMMMQIQQIIETNSWPQTIAAKKCGTTQARISALLNGKINDFTLDALVRMAGHLNLKIDVSFSEQNAA